MEPPQLFVTLEELAGLPSDRCLTWAAALFTATRRHYSRHFLDKNHQLELIDLAWRSVAIQSIANEKKCRELTESFYALVPAAEVEGYGSDVLSSSISLAALVSTHDPREALAVMDFTSVDFAVLVAYRQQINLLDPSFPTEIAQAWGERFYAFGRELYELVVVAKEDYCQLLRASSIRVECESIPEKMKRQLRMPPPLYEQFG